MTAGRKLPFVLLAAALALAAVALWRTRPRESEAPAAPAAGAAEAVTAGDGGEQAAEEEPPLAPLGRQSVLVYFPSAESMRLVGETREIFGTAAPGDRAKQIISDLLSGPTTPAATRAVPAGTRLRQVYVLDSGVAFVDFSDDLTRGLGGGTTTELLTVYAIVDSVALNVSEIKKVGILIDGKPVETLNGHIDLRRPLPPDRSYLVDEESSEGRTIVRAGGR